MEEPRPLARHRVGRAAARVKVGPARHDELSALGAIWRELMELHASTDPRFALADDALARWTAMAEDLLDRQQGFLLAARAGKTPVGFCLGWIARNPPIYRVPEIGFISEIAVARRHQRRGVGRALICAAVRFFRAHGVDEFQLSTAEWNETACAFWRALGGELLLLRYRFALDHPLWRNEDADE